MRLQRDGESLSVTDRICLAPEVRPSLLSGEPGVGEFCRYGEGRVIRIEESQCGGVVFIPDAAPDYGNLPLKEIYGPDIAERVGALQKELGKFCAFRIQSAEAVCQQHCAADHIEGCSPVEDLFSGQFIIVFPGDVHIRIGNEKAFVHVAPADDVASDVRHGGGFVV